MSLKVNRAQMLKPFFWPNIMQNVYCNAFMRHLPRVKDAVGHCRNTKRRQKDAIFYAEILKGT